MWFGQEISILEPFGVFHSVLLLMITLVMVGSASLIVDRIVIACFLHIM